MIINQKWSIWTFWTFLTFDVSLSDKNNNISMFLPSSTSSLTCCRSMLRIYTILLAIFVSLTFGAIKRPPVNDLSLRQYTEDGEIAQVSYANEAVLQAMPILGWIEPSLDASVIITCSHSTSPLCLSTVHMSDVLEGTTIFATTGLRTDCRQLLIEANNIMLSNQFLFSHSSTVEKLCNKLAIWLTKGMYSQSGEDDPPPARPFATAALISQFDAEAKKVKLFQLRNSGSFQECSFSCLGRLSEDTVRKIRRVALSDITTTITTTTIKSEVHSSSIGSDKNQESHSLFAKLNIILRTLSVELDCGVDSEGSSNKDEDTEGEIKFQVCLLLHDRIHRTELTSRQLLKFSVLHDT
jgi:20S proteasome alpha/beta subunit